MDKLFNYCDVNNTPLFITHSRDGCVGGVVLSIGNQSTNQTTMVTPRVKLFVAAFIAVQSFASRPSTPHLNLYREHCGHCLPQTKEGTHSQNCAVSRWSFWDSFVQRQITHIPVMDLEGFGKMDAEQTGIQHSFSGDLAHLQRNLFASFISIALKVFYSWKPVSNGDSRCF